MKILKALLATILLSPLTANALTNETGIKLLEAIKFYEKYQADSSEMPNSITPLFSYTYHIGYAEGLIIGDNDRTICVPQDATPRQFMLVVEKYLKEHPEELHEPAYRLIDIALMEAFPCEDTEENP